MASDDSIRQAASRWERKTNFLGNKLADDDDDEISDSKGKGEGELRGKMEE